MSPTLSLQAKAFMGLSGVLVPGSSTFLMFRQSDISAQNKKYLQLVNHSKEVLVDLVEEQWRKSGEFMEAPDHKYASSYEDAVDIHMDPKKCNIKVKILGQNWRNLEDIEEEKWKISIATGVYSLGTWRLNNACASEGIGSILWLEQKRVYHRKDWRVWTLHSSKEETGMRRYRAWEYQK